MAAAVAPPPSAQDDLPIEEKTVRALTLQSVKRARDLFAGNHGQRIPLDENSQRAKIACKVRDEYAPFLAYQPPGGAPKPERGAAAASGAAPGGLPEGGEEGAAAPAAAEAGGKGGPSAALPKSTTAKLIESMPAPADSAAKARQAAAGALVLANAATVQVPLAAGGSAPHVPSAQLAKRLPSKWPRPVWHPPWKNYRVCSSHMGWVRSIAVDSGNEWFCTGSADRCIKVWDLASGELKLTLTGHIEQVTGLAVSDRHPYLFSAGLDKQVKCWDLEYNKVIRQYHGHLSGVYSLALHPTLDILCTGGRDSVCRVWDMRTKVQVHCLTGHDETVCSILTQSTDPQVVTGSHDKTVRLWDIRGARHRTLGTLTYHKKAVRALALHPTEYAFASAGADNVKKFRLPQGEFLHNMLQMQRAIVNCAAVNEEGVLVTGADNGSLWFWDWKSGNVFQEGQTVVQPGSLESEAGIFAAAFDQSGSRLLTAEADKTVKFWREDPDATPETHPIRYKVPKSLRRF